MAEDPAAAAGEDPAKGSADPKSDVAPAPKKQRPGFFSRLRGMFGGSSSEDFEKKLRHLSKEEASVHARLKRRALSSRRMARNIIVLAVVLEVVAVGYAIMTTRSLDLNWQMRAVRVLPMFLLPALSSLIYTALVRFTRMLDRKDQKTLERLRAERQAKIDELKERTNYYTTQQLIQRYDLDPAAKAAAATVLASKLGADSGLRVYLGDDLTAESGKSNDVELTQSSGLRNRKSPQLVKSHSTGSAAMAQFIDETAEEQDASILEASGQNQRVVEHYKGSGANDGSWMARIAALLVGEDPTQCYALICGNCRMHNGLARKEDFQYVTYYCPHCHALNGSRQPEVGSSSSSGKNTSMPASPSEENSGNSLATIHELSPEGSEEQEAAVKAG